jgi:hypothetical protein
MSLTMEQRFWSHVDASGDCWLWTASVWREGYGRLATPSVNGCKGTIITAHRYSAMLHFGMFDTRLHVLHRCDTPRCVRPDHLFLGDRSDNMRDMVAKDRHFGFDKSPEQYAKAMDGYRRWQAKWVAPTHCGKGHEYTPANTMMHKDGRRRCRECNRIRSAARRSTHG